MEKLIRSSGFHFLAEQIFAALDNYSLLQCILVCKEWNHFIDSNKFLWNLILQRFKYKVIRIRDFGTIRYSPLIEEFPSLDEIFREIGTFEVSEIKKILNFMKKYCNSENEFELGELPLHYACKLGQIEIVQLFLRTSMDFMSIIEPYMVTPFHIACCEGHFGIVKLLFEHSDEKSIDINAKNFLGMTPFLWACLNGRTEIVQFLLESSETKVSEPDNSGMTPLHWTCSKGHVLTTKKLLESGNIITNAKDRSGLTPFHNACTNGHIEIVQLLLQENVNLNNETDNKGMTLFHHACKEGHSEIVELILNHGNIDIDVMDNEGNTPFALACYNGHNELVKQMMNLNISKNVDDAKFLISQKERQVILNLINEMNE